MLMSLRPFETVRPFETTNNIYHAVEITVAEEGAKVGECVFDEWWLWERGWQMETKIPYSSINECGYSVC